MIFTIVLVCICILVGSVFYLGWQAWCWIIDEYLTFDVTDDFDDDY